MKAVFAFSVKNKDGKTAVWTVDVKNGDGCVEFGSDSKYRCTGWESACSLYHGWYKRNLWCINETVPPKLLY